MAPGERRALANESGLSTHSIWLRPAFHASRALSRRRGPLASVAACPIFQFQRRPSMPSRMTSSYPWRLFATAISAGSRPWPLLLARPLLPW